MSFGYIKGMEESVWDQLIKNMWVDEYTFESFDDIEGGLKFEVGK